MQYKLEVVPALHHCENLGTQPGLHNSGIQVQSGCMASKAMVVEAIHQVLNGCEILNRYWLSVLKWKVTSREPLLADVKDLPPPCLLAG